MQARTTNSATLFRSDAQRLFTSWKLYASFIVGLILILRPLFENYLSWTHSSPMQLLSIPLALSDFTPFAVIFCTLAFADSFCEDINSGYQTYIVLRTGVRKYALQRCFWVALSGALVMGTIMSVTIIVSVSLAGQPDTAETVSFMQDTIWHRMNVIIPYNGIILYICRIILAILFGAVWALVGLLISVIIPNRYVTLIAPFVFYQISWYLFSGTMMNPLYLFRADFYIPSFSFAVIVQILSILLFGGASYFGMYRRIKV